MGARRNDRAIVDALEKMYSVGLRLLRHFMVEFMEFKQGNMIVTEYGDKFERLSKICLHYIGVDTEGSKCVKLESGLHLEIKYIVCY